MTVTVCDVGARDGLQNPVRHARAVGACGARRPPRGRGHAAHRDGRSFVSPKHVPQMAGAEEVVAAIERREGVVYAGLAVNERGYDRLRDSKLDEVHFAFAATEEFNRRNAGVGVDEGIADAEQIVARAAADGIRSTAGAIGVAFGCPFRGPSIRRALPSSRHGWRRSGEGEIAVADTIGVGVPRQVRDLVARLVPLGVPVGIHLHNTRNTGRLPRMRSPRSRPGRRCSTPQSVGSRRLPLRARGDREHRHRGPRVPAPRRRRGRRRGSTSTH